MPVAGNGVPVLRPIAMTYWDVPSGFLSQAGETVRVVAVLEATVRIWPAPSPAVILTGRPAHWSVLNAWVVSWSVVLVSTPLAVPAAPVPTPLSPGTTVPSSANTVPLSAVAVP